MLFAICVAVSYPGELRLDLQWEPP